MKPGRTDGRHALMSKLVELKGELDAMGWDLMRHQYFGGMGPNGDGSFPREMELLVEIVKGLEERGCSSRPSTRDWWISRIFARTGKRSISAGSWERTISAPGTASMKDLPGAKDLPNF